MNKNFSEWAERQPVVLDSLDALLTYMLSSDADTTKALTEIGANLSALLEEAVKLSAKAGRAARASGISTEAETIATQNAYNKLSESLVNAMTNQVYASQMKVNTAHKLQQCYVWRYNKELLK